MSNVDTIKQIYAAFVRGDVPAILEQLDENVEWDTENDVPGVPWIQPRRGRGNIPGFFESMAPLQFTRFDPHTFFADGNKVFALVHIEATHRGKSYGIRNEGHYFTFNASGKVIAFQHVCDTAKHQLMARGE